MKQSFKPTQPADGSQCIGIREKMLEFSSVVLPAPSPYHLHMHNTSTAVTPPPNTHTLVQRPLFRSNWVSRLPLNFYPSTVPTHNVRECGYYRARCSAGHPTNSIRALKKTPSNEHHQEESSFIHQLKTKGNDTLESFPLKVAVESDLQKKTCNNRTCYDREVYFERRKL